MGEEVKAKRPSVSGQFPTILIAMGVGIFLAEKLSMLTWWAVLKYVFWPIGIGYYIAEFLYLKGW